jgi:hypothetical protein
MLDGNTANSGRNRYNNKKFDDVIDAEYYAVSDVTSPVTDALPLEPMPWGTAVKLALYHTVYNIENYNTPGKILDKRV